MNGKTIMFWVLAVAVAAAGAYLIYTVGAPIVGAP